MKVNHESNKIVFTWTPIVTQTFPTHETVGGLDEVDHHRNREVAVDHVGVDQVKVILKLNRVS